MSHCENFFAHDFLGVVGFFEFNLVYSRERVVEWLVFVFEKKESAWEPLLP